MAFVPPVGRARLEAALGGRTEWCISRQRAWGVPIPALFDEASGEVSQTWDRPWHPALRGTATFNIGRQGCCGAVHAVPIQRAQSR